MNPIPSFPRGDRRRASAMVMVMMFSLVLLLLAGSVTGWSLHERRMNARQGYWLESRNAAEAVTEYACYQVAQAFNTRMNPTFNAGGTNPISLPSTFSSSFFGGSHVDPGSMQAYAGNVQYVPQNGMCWIDPNDPANELDPLKGQWVSRRDVTVVGAASVIPPTAAGGPVTTYIKESVSIRGAPLLAWAIFYSNNDLEFGETPQMDIFGPVHVNGNLFVGPAGPSGSTPSPLGFHGPVTASGAIFHAWRGTSSTAQEGGSILSSSTAVNFSTDGVGATTATMFNMRTSGGVWNDSTMGADASTSGLANLIALLNPSRNAAFASYADQNWHGNVKTGAMGIQAYNPIGFSEVIAHDSVANKDIYATDPAADSYGYGPHSLIDKEAPLPAASDPYVTGKQAIEQVKFSRNASLVVSVDPSSGVITLYGDPNSAPPGTPAANRHPVDTGRLKLVDSTDTAHFPTQVFQYIPYTPNPTNTNYPKYGMYDQRQGKQMNLVQINLGKLRTALADMATSTTTANVDIINTYSGNTKWGPGTTGTGYYQNTSGSTGWNGGVYVEVAQPSATSQQAGVILSNGKVSGATSLVPNGTTDGLTPPNNITGLTVATNAPVYILGHLNADGAIGAAGTNTNSALYPDDYPTTPLLSSKESPVAIAGDAVTVLSPNYFGTGSSTNAAPDPVINTTFYSSSNAYNSYMTKAPNAASSAEIAAALITGTVTTSPDSTGTQMYSGGVHNLPRFLENWTTNSTTVAIRGSMVSMFNSKIATAGWSQAYYSAPKRQWGFDQIFAAGKYPPMCPTVISYRRVDFTYISPAEYASWVNQLK